MSSTLLEHFAVHSKEQQLLHPSPVHVSCSVTNGSTAAPPHPHPPQLCEFIEDCEFTFLSVQILHLLGEEGPKTKDPGARGAPLLLFFSAQGHRNLLPCCPCAAACPACAWPPPLLLLRALPAVPAAARYIRYIYNRVILENATVGAATHPYRRWRLAEHLLALMLLRSSSSAVLRPGPACPALRNLPGPPPNSSCRLAAAGARRGAVQPGQVWRAVP